MNTHMDMCIYIYDFIYAVATKCRQSRCSLEQCVTKANVHLFVCIILM